MKRGLETFKREHGRKKLSDGKTIGGRNRLSGRNIIRLQTTFASTIRKCKHDLNYYLKDLGQYFDINIRPIMILIMIIAVSIGVAI
ncbi:unnamed protein product [Rotaria sp. Silwood1]|nr:unnamed protein product [Rotaria sp. Silwood1]